MITTPETYGTVDRDDGSQGLDLITRGSLPLKSIMEGEALHGARLSRRRGVVNNCRYPEFNYFPDSISSCSNFDVSFHTLSRLRLVPIPQ